MQKEEFDPQLFKQVIDANLKRLIYEIEMAAENKATMTGRAIMTEEQTRQFARDFFNYKLAAILADRIKT